MKQNEMTDESLVIEIGKTIKLLRIEKNISQAELSHRVNQAASYVSRVEAGKYKITILSLDVYLRALGISFVEFFSILEKNKKKDE